MVEQPVPSPWSPAGVTGTVIGAAIGTVGAAVEIGRRLPGWLAAAPRTVEALPSVAADVTALPRRIAGVDDALTGLAPVLDDVLGRVAALWDDPATVDRVDRLTEAVVELAGAVGPLTELAGARQDLATLAGAVEREDLARLAAAVADPVTEDDGAVPRLAALDANVSEAADQLSAVAPDLRSVATRIDALDRQIGVLADALAPLQGTTERIGRIVDRLPDRSRRLVARPTPES